MKYLPFSQTKIMNSFFKPARISPKENSGANGKFLPKPLLFHLRLPNSKTNELKFCQILSPENSFGKTETNLFLNFVRPQKGVWGMNAGGFSF